MYISSSGVAEQYGWSILYVGYDCVRYSLESTTLPSIYWSPQGKKNFGRLSSLESYLPIQHCISRNISYQVQNHQCHAVSWTGKTVNFVFCKSLLASFTSSLFTYQATTGIVGIWSLSYMYWCSKELMSAAEPV